ncbi:MAG: D-alanine-D-alanine ligase [Gammaproteobacteria bacterium]
MKSSGFIDVEMKHALDTKSERNQDLGMMAKRNIVIGKVDKPDIKIIPGGVKSDLQIAVLLGDPTKHDEVKPGATFDEDDYHTINELKKALATLDGYHFSYFDRHDDYLNNLPKWKKEIDLVLNLCDEGFNNNALYELHVPAMLEAMDIPYTGGNPQCLAYCYDKSLIRGLAHEMDIPVADAYVVKPEDTTYIDINVAFPVIIKPNFGDSSIGITRNSVCYNVTELEQGITEVRKIFGYDNPILVEQYLTGKDISVGVIGNTSDNLVFLPVIEEDYSSLPEGYPHICGYEAKWDPDSPYWQLRSVPAMLPDKTEAYLQASCAKLFERTECRDYARFDWRLDDNGTPRLLEVNPNPGWCWDGHLCKMAKLADISYAEMLGNIIKSAIGRQKIKRTIVTTQGVA